MAEQDIETLNYKQLKEKCVVEGVSAIGTKKQLLIALRAHFESKSNNINTENRITRRQTVHSNFKRPPNKKLPTIIKNHSVLNVTMIDESYDDDSLQTKSVPPPNMQQLQELEMFIPPKSTPKLHYKAVSAPVNVPKSIKMKRLYWNPIPVSKIKGSIWDNMDNKSIEYDTKHFELHFQVRVRKPMDEEKKNIKPFRHNKKIKIISKKRGQEILNTLSELGINVDELRNILHNMDENIMTVDKLSKLLSIIPTFDEQNKAETFLDSNNLNDDIERFLYSLSDFYHLEQRLKLWMFKQQFIEITDGLISEYKIIGNACNNIKNNKNLRLLLSIILSFGNFMNYQNKQEIMVGGFDISILTQLIEITSFDSTHSLLMYIYEFCDKKYPNALLILSELKNILKSAISIEIEMLKYVYERITNNMNEINELIHSEEIENYDINDRFIMVLTEFYKICKIKIKMLSNIIKSNEILMKECMFYFCYGNEINPKRIEIFFQIWWKFIIDFGSSKQRLIQLKKDRQKRIEKRKKLKNISKNKQLPILYKQSTIDKELEKIKTFNKYKMNLHGKLKDVVKRRTIFIDSGGILDEKNKQNDTMKRLATHYQTQVKSAENVRKILGYDKFIRETRKKAALLEYKNNDIIVPKMNSISQSHPNIHRNGIYNNCTPAIALKQSESDIFAENDEMENWHLKHNKLENKYNELKLLQKISDNNNNKLMEKLNEMQKLNEDLLNSIKNEKQNVIMFLNKEMNKFCDLCNNNNNNELMVQNDELNELMKTNKMFTETIENISLKFNNNNNNNLIVNISNYDEWNINEMIEWIKTLENGKYIKYCNVLKNGFETDGITNGGQLLVFDDQSDLRNKPFNILSIYDRKALIKHFQSLPALKMQSK